MMALMMLLACLLFSGALAEDVATATELNVATATELDVATATDLDIQPGEGAAYATVTDLNACTVLGKTGQRQHGGENSLVLTYGASGFTSNFEGTEFWMYVPEMPTWDNDGDGKSEYQTQRIMVLVDTDMPMEARCIYVENPGWYRLASGLEKGSHTITVYKADRGFYGIMAALYLPISRIATDGAFETPNPLKDLVIEVYGDSISNGDAVWTDGKNPQAYTYGAYGGVVARLLGAELRVCGNSGNGLLGWVLAGGANGRLDNLFPPQNSWDKIDPNQISGAWSHEGANAADVVIINLGTNDRVELGNGDLTPEVFTAEYVRFIKQIKTDCPDAMVIGCIGAMDAVKEFSGAIQAAVDEVNQWHGSEFAYYVELQNCRNIKDGMGHDNSHPSQRAHEQYGLQIARLINEKLSLGVELPEEVK